MDRSSSVPRDLRVILLRHGPAEEQDPVRWPDDERRPLSYRETPELKRAVRGLARLVAPVGTLASSPALRARGTAELLHAELDPSVELETWAELSPGAVPGPIFERLARSTRRDSSVVLVGHEPTLSEFAGVALVREPIGLLRLDRGGGSCLEFRHAIEPGSARLAWLLTRQQLAVAGR